METIKKTFNTRFHSEIYKVILAYFDKNTPEKLKGDYETIHDIIDECKRNSKKKTNKNNIKANPKKKPFRIINVGEIGLELFSGAIQEIGEIKRNFENIDMNKIDDICDEITSSNDDIDEEESYSILLIRIHEFIEKNPNILKNNFDNEINNYIFINEILNEYQMDILMKGIKNNVLRELIISAFINFTYLMAKMLYINLINFKGSKKPIKDQFFINIQFVCLLLNIPFDNFSVLDPMEKTSNKICFKQLYEKNKETTSKTTKSKGKEKKEKVPAKSKGKEEKKEKEKAPAKSKGKEEKKEKEKVPAKSKGKEEDAEESDEIEEEDTEESDEIEEEDTEESDEIEEEDIKYTFKKSKGGKINDFVEKTKKNYKK